MVRAAIPALLFAVAATSAHAEDKGPFDVLSYQVTLTVDPQTRHVAGDETIRLRVRDAGAPLAFSDNALEIVGSSVPVRRANGRMVFEVPETRQGQEVTLKVTFRGKPKRGLIFEPDAAYTSYFACDWMICDQDRPGDKAPLALSLMLPSGWRALSTRAAEGAYGAYLYGFAAGRLNVAPLGAGLSASSATLSEEVLRTRLAPTSEMVAFFSGRAGLPLPAGRYRQFVSAAPEAQEGTSFAILGTANLPTAEAPEEDWAIAHELAHQWWGNIVTCETWREMWLNEGFAVFMTAAWKEHRWGRAAYDREMALARRRLAASAAAGFDKPLAWAGDYPSLQIRRGVQYSKGALFLDALRTRLGDDTFWRVIRDYTRRHAGGTVTSRDFEAAIEAEAPGRATDLVRDWVFGASLTSGS